MLKSDVIHECRRETYCVTVKDKFMLSIWKRKIPRKVYGPVTEQEVWRIRTNQKMRELHKTPDLVAGIERGVWSGWGMRLEWITQRWLRKIFKASHEVVEKWEGLD